MRQHESSSAAEHLRMMAKRNSALESKVTVVTVGNGARAARTGSTCVWFLQLDDVKGELLERFKVLPVLSSRVAELESSNDELREKNRQTEQKLGTMQVTGAPLLPGYHCGRAGRAGRYGFNGTRPNSSAWL